MPRVSTMQTNFTAGEISPKVRGRVDIARYQNGAEELRNVLVNVYGGAERAPGTRMIAPIKDQASGARLMPFIFNREVSYVLEFGEGYMRVYRSNAGQIVSGDAPYEIPTPFTLSIARTMRFAQKDDTVFIATGILPVYMLQRLGETNWRLRPAPFSVVPFAETGRTGASDISISDPSTGVGRTVVASVPVFYNSDVGRRITSGPGIATITGFTAPTQVTVDVSADFLQTFIGVGQWRLEDSPQAPLKPSAKGTTGQSIDLTFQTSETPGTPQPKKNITDITVAIGGVVTATVPGHGYATGSLVRIAQCVPDSYNGQFNIEVTGPDTFEYDPDTSLSEIEAMGTAQWIPPASSTGYTGWRGDEVGQYVRINRGLVQITQVVNATVARGVVRASLDSDVEAPASAWSLEQSVWGGEFGFPQAVTINQQRLVLGGTTRDPNGVWGSRTGLYFDFTLGDEDSDAFFYALDGESNGIKHLASLRALLAFTLGTEWTMTGGVEKPLTPTNVQAKDQSVYGSTDVRPVRIADELIFLQRAAKRVLAMSYSVETDSYRSPDLTVLSEHLTRSGVVAMAYQQEPVSVLWCVCADGSMATMTISRDEGVIAWTRQETEGAFEDVCVVPIGEYDEVWALVRRTVAGQTRRYVERFSAAAMTHSCVVGTSAPGATVWGGMEHLEGMKVQVLADGSRMGEFTVQGGEITLPRAAHDFQAGLQVVPRVKLLRPEVGTSTGTAQASRMRPHEFNVLFLDTIGARVNGKRVAFRQFGPDILDKPPQPYSGWKGVGALGWQKGEMECVIEQPDPLPFHVLGVVRKWTTND